MAPTMPKSQQKKTKSPGFKRKTNIPNKSKKQIAKELEEVTEEDRRPGVVYIGHIPHGFFERELNEYFSQFGRVLDIKLSRSKKTGNSKGYAFIKFQYAAVAKTVADTCHNYLFFNKLLKCEYKPMSDIHPETFFRYHMQKNWRPKRLHNQPKSEDKLETSFKDTLGKQKKKLNKLKALGLDLDLDDVAEISNNRGPNTNNSATKEPPQTEPPKNNANATPKSSVKRKATEVESSSPSPAKSKSSPALKKAKLSSSPGVDVQPAAKKAKRGSPSTVSPSPKSPPTKRITRSRK